MGMERFLPLARDGGWCYSCRKIVGFCEHSIRISLPWQPANCHTSYCRPQQLIYLNKFNVVSSSRTLFTAYTVGGKGAFLNGI